MESKNPKAGKYTFVLDPVRVPEEGLKVAYRDVVYHTVFGTVTSNDTATELKPGEIKRAAVSFDVQARPEKGRQLVAEVGLFSDDVVTMNFDKPEGAKPTDPSKSPRDQCSRPKL
ncbi:MAG TPA: hypothetical protein VKE24_12795 [Candidatus Acidoferrales bacterium]|nr:hypothetical protein [Candidatus Acidoferrales bacterium]